MESNDKHILDKQLHDKLYDQEVTPPDFDWDNIEAELDGKTIPQHSFIFKGLMIATAIAVSVGILSTLMHLNDTHGTKSMNNAVSTSTESLNAPSKVQTYGGETDFSNSETNAATTEYSDPIQSQIGNVTTTENSASTPNASNQDNHISSSTANQNIRIGKNLPALAKASSLPNKKDVSGLQKTPQLTKEQTAMNAPLLNNEKPAHLIPAGIKSKKEIAKTNKGKALKKNTSSSNDLQTRFEEDHSNNGLSTLIGKTTDKTILKDIQNAILNNRNINKTPTQELNKNTKSGQEVASEISFISKENISETVVSNKPTSGKLISSKGASKRDLTTRNTTNTETSLIAKGNKSTEGSETNQQKNAVKLTTPDNTKVKTPVKDLESNQIDQNANVKGIGTVKAAEVNKSEVQKNNSVPVSKEQTLGSIKNDSTVAIAPKTVLLDSSKTKPADAVTVKSRDSSAVKKSKLKISPNGVVFQMLYNQPNYANLNGTSTASNLTSALSLNSKSLLASLLYNTSIHPLIDINVGLSYQYNTVTVVQNLTTVKKYNDTTHRFFDSLVVVGVDTFGIPKYANQQFNEVIITEKSEEYNTNNTFQNQYAYLGVPLEVIFKKDLSKKLQFMALFGFRMQFLVYENLAEANAESKVTVASHSFNYYGSIGLGYKLTDKLTLTAALNMANLSAGQLNIYNNNSTSKLVFSPELRCSWFIF